MSRTPRSYGSLSPQALALLRQLFESRVMTIEHAAAFHFCGRYEAAKKAAQRLKDRGLVGDRDPVSGRVRPLRLTLAGIDALQAAGALDVYPPMSRRQRALRSQVSDLTLAHELAVLDVKASFVRALGTAVTEFVTWPALSQFEAALPGEDAREVKPDGFARLRLQGNGPDDAFFVEVDRSTESLGVLSARLQRYAAFHRSGGFAKRCGGHASEIGAHPFRVLVVVESRERRNNVAEALLSCFPPVLSLVWIGTRSEVLADPLSACWVCPVDYRDATAAMPPAGRGRGGWYRRDREREGRIEGAIRKRAIGDRRKKKGGREAA